MGKIQSARKQNYSPGRQAPNYHYRSFSERRAGKKGGQKLFITIIIVVILGYFSVTWLIPTLIGGLSFLTKSQDNKTISQTEAVVVTPPVLNIPFESTNSASIQIKGYSFPDSNVEIYIDDELKTTVKSSTDGGFSSGDISLNIGTNNIYGKTVDSKGNKSLSSKTIQITYYNEKPKLEIKEPEDNKTITGGDKKVTVSGSTDADRGMTISINGTRVIVNSDGNFQKTISLNDGDNEIVILATDTAGNTTQLTRKVTYNPQPNQ